MTYYEISLETPLKYDLTGKFQAPSPEWMHFTRYMQNFELIVVTEGTAYLQIDEQFFNVCRGEFMLFPPLSKQSGYKSSSCAFIGYTLHMRIHFKYYLQMKFHWNFLLKKYIFPDTVKQQILRRL